MLCNCIKTGLHVSRPSVLKSDSSPHMHTYPNTACFHCPTCGSVCESMQAIRVGVSTSVMHMWCWRGGAVGWGGVV